MTSDFREIQSEDLSQYNASLRNPVQLSDVPECQSNGPDGAAGGEDEPLLHFAEVNSIRDQFMDSDIMDIPSEDLSQYNASPRNPVKLSPSWRGGGHCQSRANRGHS